MRVKFVVCAAVVVADQFTGRMTLVHVIDRLGPTPIPVLLPPVACLMVVERSASDPETVSGRLLILLGTLVVGQIPFFAHFGTQEVHNVVLPVQGLLVPAAGDLTFRAEIAGGEAATFTVTVSPLLSPTVVSQPAIASVDAALPAVDASAGGLPLTPPDVVS